MRCNSSHLARPLFAMVVLLYHTAPVTCAPLSSRPPQLLALLAQQDFWQQYKGLIIVGLALLVIEGFLIAAVLRERRRKKFGGSPAEAALIKSEEFNRRIVESTSDNAKVLDLDRNRISTLVENFPDIICRLDRELRYIYISPALESLTGEPKESFLGKTTRESAVPGFDWQGFESACREAIASRKLVQQSSSYHERHYSTRAIPELATDGAVESVMTITEDVTDRIRSERELVQLTGRLFDIQDQERRRIARELHDGTAQNLFAISMNLQKMSRLNSSNDELEQLIAECQALDEQSLQEVRTLSYLLHPPLLDQTGLVSALQWYVEGFSKRSGIYVDLFAAPIGRLQPDVEIALFRVVQEALANVHRHSTSETASIRLEYKNGAAVLQIKDQGNGFAIADHNPGTNGTVSLGVGIPGMKQRLRQLGGTLDITSDNGGTTVSAVVPVTKGTNHGADTGG